jgi:iron complex outermembrane receptor protein
VGDEFVDAPDDTLGLWVCYDTFSIDSAFSMGIDYVSERTNLIGRTVIPYVGWDASLTTTYKTLDVQLYIRNLTGKVCASSDFKQRYGYFPGEL